MPEERTWIQPLVPSVRLGISYTGRRIERFSVRLEVERDGQWMTIRQIDNHHDIDGVAHMHRYCGTEKQAAERWTTGRPNETMPQAIGYIRETWQPILASWERT
jgi:hypothetical protein